MYKHARAMRGVSFVYGRETRASVAKATPTKKAQKGKKRKPPKTREIEKNKRLKAIRQRAAVTADMPNTKPKVAEPAVPKVDPPAPKKPSRVERMIANNLERIAQGDTEREARKGKTIYKFTVAVRPRSRHPSASRSPTQK